MRLNLSCDEFYGKFATDKCIFNKYIIWNCTNVELKIYDHKSTRK